MTAKARRSSRAHDAGAGARHFALTHFLRDFGARQAHHVRERNHDAVLLGQLRERAPDARERTANEYAEPAVRFLDSALAVGMPEPAVTLAKASYDPLRELASFQARLRKAP
jgi:hypothetical protein